MGCGRFQLFRGGCASRGIADRAHSDYAPTNYTPALVIGLSEFLTQLASHLSGIDTSLGTLSGGKLGSAYTQVVGDDGTAQATGADTLGLGGDLVDIEVNWDADDGFTITFVGDKYDSVAGDTGSGSAVGSDTLDIVGDGTTTETEYTGGQLVVRGLGPTSSSRRFVSGRYYGPDVFNQRGAFSSVAGGLTAGNATVIATRVTVGTGVLITDLTIEVETGTSGGEVGLALYADDGTDEPGDLIDGATGYGAAAATFRTHTIADGGHTTTSPYVWLAMTSNNTAVKFAAINSTAAGTNMGQTNGATSLGTTIMGFVKANTYSNGFPASLAASSVTTASLPLVVFEVST